jgi:hypothetical protein
MPTYENPVTDAAEAYEALRGSGPRDKELGRNRPTPTASSARSSPVSGAWGRCSTSSPASTCATKTA